MPTKQAITKRWEYYRRDATPGECPAFIIEANTDRQSIALIGCDEQTVVLSNVTDGGNGELSYQEFITIVEEAHHWLISDAYGGRRAS